MRDTADSDTISHYEYKHYDTYKNIIIKSMFYINL